MRKRMIGAGVAAAAWLAVASASSATQWHAVPGAPDIAIDLASLETQAGAARVWVRLVGSGRQLGVLRPEVPGRSGAQVHRVVAHAQFDCRQRRLRILQAQGYLGNGTPAFMSSVPSAEAPVPADDSLAWTYDAVCEVARARGDQR